MPARPGGGALHHVATWKNAGKDIHFRGETYVWSKHLNFLRVIDLPSRTRQPLEMALEVEDAATRDLLARQRLGLTRRVRRPRAT